MPNEAAARRRSYLLGTSGLAAVKGRPVRMYITGSNAGDAVLAVTSMDAHVIGFAAGGCATAGFAFPVVDEEGAWIQANVNTTVVQGSKLRCGAGGQLWDAGATTGNKYIAVALKDRTNTGYVYVRYEKGEV